MEPLESTASAGRAIQRVNYSHDAMIDVIIAIPGCTQNTIAQHFGYSVGWISRIMCSDAFQARLQKRREEIINPGLVTTFEERLRGLAAQSLDILVEKLDVTETQDPITGKILPVDNSGMALKCLELSAKALGYGARQTNVAVQANFNVKTVSDEQLMQIAMGVSV